MNSTIKFIAYQMVISIEFVDSFILFVPFEFVSKKKLNGGLYARNMYLCT